MALSWLFTGTFLLYISITTCFAIKCPCFIDMDKATANCSARNLTRVPDCVPMTTQHLNFASNDLQYHRMQFHRFKTLKYLDLSDNPYFQPGNDSFTGLSDLTVLYLNQTSLSLDVRLENNVFAGLKQLKILAINGVNVYLPEGLFDGLASLIHLNLSNSYTLYNQDYQFTDLENLLYLDLSFSNIQSTSIYTFHGLSSLRFLALKDSSWYQSNNTASLFQPLTSLEELHIEGACLYIKNCSGIDKLLMKIPTLKKLYIHNAVLDSPLGLGFSVLRHLTEIHFTHPPPHTYSRSCQMKILNEHIFQSLRDLSIANISIHDCHIDLIEQYAFRNFKALNLLDLEIKMKWCNILFNRIATGLDKTQIKRIRLAANCRFLSRPSDPLLSGLEDTKLESLDLSQGLIEFVDKYLIVNIPKSLKYLYMCNNRIKFIDPKPLHALENLLILDLSNQFGNTKTSNNNWVMTEQLDNNCVPLPHSLVSLNVSNSALLCMMIQALCGSNFSLRIFHAAHQISFDCQMMFWKTLKTIISIEELDLSWNNIAYLPFDAFVGQKRLKRLFLARNLLLKLDFVVYSLETHQYIDLSGNAIQYATTRFTKTIQHIATYSAVIIYLENNSLLCDCSRSDFISWLQTTNAIFRKDKLTCTYKNGTELSLAYVSRVHYLLETECIALKVTLLCVTIFISLNLLLGLIVMSWHYSSKFNYLLSLSRRNLNPYHPLENTGIFIEYDVYISYERDYNITPDETLHEFVTEKIYPRLKQRGLKVIIREELDIGRRLYDVIAKTLRRCDKVLVLLSKEYCVDYWNVFEFNVAAMEGIYTKREVVLPIALEAIGAADLHHEIHTFLSVRPVPAYTRESSITEHDFVEYICKRIRDNKPFD